MKALHARVLQRRGTPREGAGYATASTGRRRLRLPFDMMTSVADAGDLEAWRSARASRLGGYFAALGPRALARRGGLDGGDLFTRHQVESRVRSLRRAATLLSFAAAISIAATAGARSADNPPRVVEPDTDPPWRKKKKKIFFSPVRA